ncbi:unnamed protein product, partial [Rotaria socialis]
MLATQEAVPTSTPT